MAVDAAIVLTGESGPDSSEPVNLDGLWEELLAALWLTGIRLSKQ